MGFVPSAKYIIDPKAKPEYIVNPRAKPEEV